MSKFENDLLRKYSTLEEWNNAERVMDALGTLRQLSGFVQTLHDKVLGLNYPRLSERIAIILNACSNGKCGEVIKIDLQFIVKAFNLEQKNLFLKELKELIFENYETGAISEDVLHRGCNSNANFVSNFLSVVQDNTLMEKLLTECNLGINMFPEHSIAYCAKEMFEFASNLLLPCTYNDI